MEEKTLIINKNGLEYYRKKKQVKYNKTISFRYEDDKIEKLKGIAEKNNTKYQTLIKDILDEYLKNKGE